ncbi:MAG: L-seryl-tRNA(Sec) selenium transferase [Candidatus Aminicenantes bacterium]|nr:L-seryl-tRNA(Sec) selenium transferase [Candidatus Aminicenantes bacterium]
MKNTSSENHDKGFRFLPSVDQLMEKNEVKQLISRYSREFILHNIRELLAAIRNEISQGKADLQEVKKRAEGLIDELRQRLKAQLSPFLHRVINATGVIIHTNLGRASLCPSAVERLQELSCRYLNLEFSLEEGRRGARDLPVERLISRMFPGKSCVVVNNNAAAVLLVLNTLAEGKEVIVSRGELVEVGGSFRIPEVMEKSGAVLKEVGTTNKTRLQDYERAISPNTALLLAVHQSNFRILGFTESVRMEELVALGRRHGIPVMEDMGSGNMIDLSPYGITDEPSVEEILAKGANIISFSGDKLLGGPQSGIIVGDKELIARVKGNPLLRAVRAGKLTYLALEATLMEYLKGKPEVSIPVLQMLSTPLEELQGRAEAIIEELGKVKGSSLKVEIMEGASKVGGGTVPLVELPSRLIAVTSTRHTADTISRKLRMRPLPVIARIQEERVIIDLRTVLPSEDRELVKALKELALAD